MSGRRALVTGGAGFIGSHLVDSLVGDGWQVRVLDDFSSGREAHLEGVAERIEVLRGDVRDAARVAEACADVEIVFHQAAVVSVVASQEDPLGTSSVNVDGTVCVLEGARAAGVRRVVLASSCAVYGSDPALPCREDQALAPGSPYAVHKASAELQAGFYAREHGLPVVCLRYFNVYGPRQNPAGDYAAVVPRFLESGLAGRAPRIHGDGSQTRDFVYVADVVRANRLAADAATGGASIVNVASGVETRILELFREVAGITGLSCDPSYSPARPGDVRRSAADTETARAAFGFEAQVDLASGLRRTADALRAGPGTSGGIAA